MPRTVQLSPASNNANVYFRPLTFKNSLSGRKFGKAPTGAFYFVGNFYVSYTIFQRPNEPE